MRMHMDAFLHSFRIVSGLLLPNVREYCKQRRMGNMIFFQKGNKWPRLHMHRNSNARTRARTRKKKTHRLLVCVTLATNTSTHPCTDGRLVYGTIFIVFFFSSFSSNGRCAVHVYFYFFFFFFSIGLLAHTLLSNWSSTLRLVLAAVRIERNNRTKSNAFLLFSLYCIM